VAEKFLAECSGGDLRVYHQRVDDVTAFVLAGGKSTRMGRDKAFLEIGGKSLLTRAMEQAKEVTEEVLVVGGREKFSPFGEVVEDIYRERGPLGAIHAALTATATEWNCFLAVDMPFMEAGFLRWLVSEARKNEKMVTVPRAAGRLQPLSSVYRKSFGEIARRSLEEGENKIDRLFTGARAQLIEEAQLVGAGFSSEMFRNVNTREEWEAVISTKH
jgi:molybdopterin-guanine dinucleotide biosynthesis protein A